MRASTGASLIAVISCTAYLFFAPNFLRADEEKATSQANAEAALGELQTWLNAGPNAKGWTDYLKLTSLDEQLAKGQQADVGEVEKSIKQLETNAPGLELTNFRKLHDALLLWSADLVLGSDDKLSEAILKFQNQFQPPGDAELASAKSELEKAISRLQALFSRLPDRGAGWRAYLGSDELQKQLQSSEPDEKVLANLSQRFVADHEGLEMPEFSQVGLALDHYRFARAAKQDDAKSQYAEQLKALAEELPKYAAGYSQELAGSVGQHLGWLEDMGQARSLVRALRARLSKPNLHVALSERLVAAGINQPIDETAPMSDVILGTDLRSTVHTVGQISAELVPNSDKAVIQTNMNATAQSRSVGYNGPATIYSVGNTSLRGSKLLMMDADGVKVLPATATASTRSQITGVAAGNGGLVQRVASNRVAESKSEGEQIASQHAAQRARQRIEAQANTQLAKANADYQKKFRHPLVRRRAFPSLLNFSTTDDNVFVKAMQADRKQLAAHRDAPDLAELGDLALRSHESSVNNMAAALLSGTTLTQEEMEARVIEARGSLPEKLKSDDSRGPWAITFADSQPVTARFTDGGLSITIRGSQYKSGDDRFRAMSVTADYKIASADDQIKLVRQGDLHIVPPGFEPGKKLSSRQITLSTLLRKKFGKIFEPEIKPEGLVLPGRWKEAGRLDLKQLNSKDGWVAAVWVESGEPAPEQAKVADK